MQWQRKRGSIAGNSRQKARRAVASLSCLSLPSVADVILCVLLFAAASRPKSDIALLPFTRNLHHAHRPHRRQTQKTLLHRPQPRHGSWRRLRLCILVCARSTDNLMRYLPARVHRYGYHLPAGKLCTTTQHTRVF